MKRKVIHRVRHCAPRNPKAHRPEGGNDSYRAHPHTQLLSVQLSALSFILLLLLTSCHARKKLVSPMAHAADYEWMSAKVSGEISLSSQLYLPSVGEGLRRSALSFTGSLRMRRDSTVWLSASAFMGVENARIRVTNDSVIVLNRVNQTYLAEPVSTVVQTMQAPSLQELQAMLLGDGSSDHVEIQWGGYSAKIKYDDIQWDEPTTFPMKINKKYERVKL